MDYNSYYSDCDDSDYDNSDCDDSVCKLLKEKYEKEFEQLVEELNKNCKERGNNMRRSDWDLDSFGIKKEGFNIYFHTYKKACNIDYSCCDSCMEYKGYFCSSCEDLLDKFPRENMKEIKKEYIATLKFTERNFEAMKRYILNE